MSASHVTGVRHTGVTVSDMDEAIGFFRDALGLPVSEKIPCSGEFFEQVTGVSDCVIDICFVTLPNHTIELLSYSSPADRASSQLRPCDTGHVHLCLDVEDIDATIAAGRQYGFEPVNPVQTATDGPIAGTRVIYTVGPGNLTIELMQAPQQETDPPAHCALAGDPIQADRGHHPGEG